ncbi:hypothetical protein [Photobacterium kishitanii]|nr:hypothetical protein [Photobacterium kishitanii]
MTTSNIRAKKTKETKKSYFERSKLMQIKAYNEYIGSGDITQLVTRPIVKIRQHGVVVRGLHIHDTAKWAKEKWASNLGRSTWRTYRSSLNYYAELMYEKQLILATDVTDIKRILSGQDGYIKRPTRTSASKKKNLVDNDFKILMSAVRKSTSAYSSILRTWLYVNRMVGLRPCEWKKTEIIPYRGELCISVKNAKNTNGRAHGDKRYVSISHLSEKDRIVIQKFSKYCKEKNDSGGFEKMYTNCRILLHNTNHRIWKKRKRHITLYSSRHQFSADLKKSGSSLTEIAYLMGHASTDTATSHYGKKRYGRSQITPNVHPDDTKGIKESFKRFSFGNMKVADTLDID